ncbi:Arb2 domain-containing protein [Halenospora varia]|nr:Arb2 domain-containing protein [Halenospora varia]
MFRRLPSGLPPDPTYPKDLKGLGYFINDKDEIRNIENPKAYFKFFLTKNDRYNCIQRESMNEVIRNLVETRMSKYGLQKILLPFGAKATEPHVPIFISSKIEYATRVIVLFYEHTQDIGILAHRVIGGTGGINSGSVINIIKSIQASPDPNGKIPGIILANMGQLRWWRKGKKAVTQTSWFSLPAKSAVSPPYRFDPIKNTIPGNRNSSEHVSYIFNSVINQLVNPSASIQVIGVSEGAYQVSAFLDSFDYFETWSKRITAVASVSSYFLSNDIKNDEFAEWFEKKARSYIVSDEPKGTFIAGPEGKKSVSGYGAPCFSLGEQYYSEMMLVRGYDTVLEWFKEVGNDREYENPVFERYDVGGEDEEDDIVKLWGGKGVPLEDQMEPKAIEGMNDEVKRMEVDDEVGEVEEVEEVEENGLRIEEIVD